MPVRSGKPSNTQLVACDSGHHCQDHATNLNREEESGRDGAECSEVNRDPRAQEEEESGRSGHMRCEFNAQIAQGMMKTNHGVAHDTHNCTVLIAGLFRRLLVFYRQK